MSISVELMELLALLCLFAKQALLLQFHGFDFYEEVFPLKLKVRNVVLQSFALNLQLLKFQELVSVLIFA